MSAQRPFWLAQALETDGEPAPALDGHQFADVCIVGGGYTGLWSAIQTRLKHPACDIVVLERDVCGAGASGRNGGCVLGWSGKFLSLLRLFGEAEALRLAKASEEAVWQIGRFCDTHGIDADFRAHGSLYTATSVAQLGSLGPVIRALDARGLAPFRALSADELLRRSGSAAHLAGVASAAAATVQPARLVRGLRRVAMAMGIRVHELSPMLDIEAGPPARVRTPRGSVRAPRLVLALNAWMPRALPAFARSIVVVSSDMVITEKCPDVLAALDWTDGVSVLDSRTFVHYYRNTSDGRVMLGKGGNTFAWRGNISPVFDQPSPCAPGLTRALHHFFPTLSGVPIAATWNGPSDRSVTGLPFFGRLRAHPHIVYGFGYSGNGVGPSYMGGELLSALVLDEDNAWTRSPLARGPLGLFPIEPFRYAGSLLVRQAIRRKEAAEDQGRRPRPWDLRLARLAESAGKADR